jgi:hypothetical protein
MGLKRLRGKDSLDMGRSLYSEAGDRFFMLVGLTTFKTKQSSHWLYVRLGRLYFLVASAQAVRVSIKESNENP